MKRKLIALGAIAVLSLTATGCSAIADAVGKIAPGASQAPVSYGMVIGSGHKTTDALGSYEMIALPQNSPDYRLNVGSMDPVAMKQAGLTNADATSAQKAAVDYVVTQFIDSTALNGGSKGYQNWFNAAAPNYLRPELLSRPDLRGQDGRQILFSDFFLSADKKAQTIPPLVHDDKPREKDVQLHVDNIDPFVVQGVGKGFKIHFDFDIKYRINDKAAIDYGSRAWGITTDQFLKTKAKPAVKDGQGENVYRVKGTTVLDMYQDSAKWKIGGYDTKADADVADFSK